MALSASACKALIQTEMEAVFGTPDDPAQMEQFAEALANAIIATVLTATIGTPTGPGTIS